MGIKECKRKGREKKEQETEDYGKGRIKEGKADEERAKRK